MEMMKQMYAFFTGFFSFVLLEALWCGPDYYLHGDITRTEELLWIGWSLVLVGITGFKWYRSNQD